MTVQSNYRLPDHLIIKMYSIERPPEEPKRPIPIALDLEYASQTNAEMSIAALEAWIDPAHDELFKVFKGSLTEQTALLIAGVP